MILKISLVAIAELLVVGPFKEDNISGNMEFLRHRIIDLVHFSHRVANRDTWS